MDLLYGDVIEVQELKSLSLDERLNHYRKRVYSLVHTGYNILVTVPFDVLSFISVF